MKDYVPLLQTGLWIVLAIVVVVILRPDLVVLREALKTRIQAGSAVEFGPVKIGELRKELDVVRDQVNDLSNQVSILFLLTMAPKMYENLRKLASGKFGPYEKGIALERELRHLRDLGYVDVSSVGDIPTPGDELLDHVNVTPTGRRFVELRESLAGAARPSSSSLDAP